MAQQDQPTNGSQQQDDSLPAGITAPGDSGWMSFGDVGVQVVPTDNAAPFTDLHDAVEGLRAMLDHDHDNKLEANEMLAFLGPEINNVARERISEEWEHRNAPNSFLMENQTLFTRDDLIATLAQTEMFTTNHIDAHAAIEQAFQQVDDVRISDVCPGDIGQFHYNVFHQDGKPDHILVGRAGAA